MVHNVNCHKKKDMIKPQKLFPLPQDKLLEPEGTPKSTPEEFKKFMNKIEKRGLS